MGACHSRSIRGRKRLERSVCQPGPLANPSLCLISHLPDAALEGVLEQLLDSMATPKELANVLCSCKAFANAWRSFVGSDIHAESLARWVLNQKRNPICEQDGPDRALKRLFVTGVHCIPSVIRFLPSVTGPDVATELKSIWARR